MWRKSLICGERILALSPFCIPLTQKRKVCEKECRTADAERLSWLLR